MLFLNVGTGKDISIKKLTELISKSINFDGIVEWDNSKPDGTPRKLLNVENIKKLGWEPKITLENGIDLTIQDYIKNISIYN